jgi:predicted acylesterase/phospholipase RssA
MEEAASYAEWLKAAQAHDKASGMAAWRDTIESRDYDNELLASRTRLLKKLMKLHDTPRLVFYLREELHGNLANMANPALYMQAKAGTKTLITDYLTEVRGALIYLCDTEIKGFPPSKKLEFFKRAAQSFGRSALLLSGGATLGLFHLGVIRELWEHRLLPRVITGSSAGALVAGVVGTNTDRQLEAFFQPGHMDLEWAQTLGFHSILKGEGILDAAHLTKTVNRNVKRLTFLEAYKRTNRIINISISPADPNQFPRLLNYLTAPNVYVRSAVMASTAIPGLFPPVQLKSKNFEGKTVPHMKRSLWIDGSVHGDVPKERVSRMHNVNHYVVSQTNPHVVPFIREEDPRKGLLPFLRQLMYSTPMVQIEHALELARRHFDFAPLNALVNKAHAVATQTYSGDVTIYPDRQLSDLLKIFSNPTQDEIQEFILAGRRSAWPKMSRVHNTTIISQTFDECLQRLNKRYRFVKRRAPQAKKRASNRKPSDNSELDSD